MSYLPVLFVFCKCASILCRELLVRVYELGKLTHSLTAALDQLRVVASSTSNDPGPRSRQNWVNTKHKPQMT